MDPHTHIEYWNPLCADQVQAWSENAVSERNYTCAVSLLKDQSGAVGLGTISGLVLATVANLLFSLKYKYDERDVLALKVPSCVNYRNVIRTFILSILLLSVPLLMTFLATAAVYKLLCTFAIRRKDKHYAGLLDGFDVFWCLEDDATKSIISVLGFIECDSAERLIIDIKEKLNRIVPDDEECTKKIFYRRSEEYGFYYWRRYTQVDLDEYVQCVEHPEDKMKELSQHDVEQIMTLSSKKALPYNDEGLFQILVTKNNIAESNRNIKKTYGIIFKIHHSVGDGVALIDFLCRILNENADHAATFFQSHEDVEKWSSPKVLLDKIYKLVQMPLCFVNGIMRQPDVNALHGPKLSGNKIFAWTDSDEKLLDKIKDVKGKVEGLKFTDILATSLASGMKNYFSEKMMHMPEEVSVILPIRFPQKSSHKYFVLENNFTVTILDLPLQNSHTEDQLNEVRRKCNDLRKSADPITNFYFLKLVGGVLPKQILFPMLWSQHATLVLSNLPGPPELTLCGGNRLKQLVFFVPHKGTTGLCVTALRYGGVLRLAASADDALVGSARHLRCLLDDMVNEVTRLRDAVAPIPAPH